MMCNAGSILLGWFFIFGCEEETKSETTYFYIFYMYETWYYTIGMGFFFSKSVVSPEEFKKARYELYSKGFTQRELNVLEELFMGYMHSSGTSQRGINATEMNEAISWLQENKSKHPFSSDQIDLISNALNKRL